MITKKNTVVLKSNAYCLDGSQNANDKPSHNYHEVVGRAAEHPLEALIYNIDTNKACGVVVEPVNDTT